MTSHIALSHTPFHLLQLGILAEQLAAAGERLLVFHEGTMAMAIPGMQHAEVIELPGATGYSDARLVAGDNARQVLSHAAWGSRSILYASDLKWLTNNLVYFSRPRETRRARTILITDGLGSYLVRRDRVRTIATSITKMVLGLVGYGPQHRPLPRNHFGLDKRYAAAVMGFNAERIVGDLEKIPLEVPKPDPSDATARHGCLVIGAPIDEQRFSTDKARHIVETMANTAIAMNEPGERLSYKPHHFERDWIADRYAELGFDIIRDARPAELVIRQHGYKSIFGTYSSALAFGPQYARCHAYSVCFDEFADGYLNQPDRVELRRVLQGFGVSFL